MEIFEGSSSLIINLKDVIKLNNMKRKKIRNLFPTPL